MEFTTDNFASHILDDLRRQRENGELCDMTLHVDGRTIQAHKCVLVSASAYFRTMFQSSFSDRDTSCCHLPNVSYGVALGVMDYIYTGKITISFDNVDEILKVADFLCLDKLTRFCSKVLASSLSDDTCLCVKLLVDRYSLADISSDVLEYVVPRFNTILHNSEALELPASTVLTLLADTRLNYVSESSLYEFVMKWVTWDLSERREELSRLLQVLDISFLTSSFIRDRVMRDEVAAGVISSVPGLQTAVQERLAEEGTAGGERRMREDIFICRSRTAKLCEEVRLLFYLPREDRWMRLAENPESHCWDGLESMVHHHGSLYFLLSTTEDMYGYMHHAEENKHLWRLDLRSRAWQKLAPPESVRGQCRLVSHINGLYVMDRLGVVAEYKAEESRWKYACSPGFTEDPNATIYFLPMPVDTHIYVFRAYSAGYSFRYARTSFSLHKYDTVRHTWAELSDIESDDLSLDEHERLHGYTFTPGRITMKDELGHPRIVYDVASGTWSSVSRRVALPCFVKDVWGSVALRTRVYFVGRMAQESPMLTFYDHEKRRFKSVTPPPVFLSGLLCHVSAPSDSVQLMTSSAVGDVR